MVEAALFPPPPVEFELLLLVDVDPLNSWLTTENETPGEFTQSEPLRAEALARKVMSAHCCEVLSVGVFPTG